MRRPGDGVEPILIQETAAVNETRGRPLGLGIDDDKLAWVMTGRERSLRIMSRRGDGQREVEHTRGTSRYDQAEDGIGGIGEAGDVPSIHAADHRLGIAIDRKRAGKVGDNLVVGVSILVMEPSIDEHAGHRRVEDAKIKTLPERAGAPSDAGMHESA
jgi:hypothetical protein